MTACNHNRRRTSEQCMHAEVREQERSQRGAGAEEGRAARGGSSKERDGSGEAVQAWDVASRRSCQYC